MKFTTLDVGCGQSPSGDVNIDLFTESIAYRAREKLDSDTSLAPKSILNFVKASAMYLPFIDNSFDIVYSSQVIAHVPDPFLMLKEMGRVTRWKLILKCPHSLGEPRKARYSPYNLHHFRPRWFWKAFKLLPFHRPTIEISSWNVLPHSVFPVFRLPAEITCTVFKKKQANGQC